VSNLRNKYGSDGRRSDFDGRVDRPGIEEIRLEHHRKNNQTSIRF